MTKSFPSHTHTHYGGQKDYFPEIHTFGGFVKSLLAAKKTLDFFSVDNTELAILTGHLPEDGGEDAV